MYFIINFPYTIYTRVFLIEQTFNVTYTVYNSIQNVHEKFKIKSFCEIINDQVSILDTMF